MFSFERPVFFAVWPACVSSTKPAASTLTSHTLCPFRSHPHYCPSASQWRWRDPQPWTFHRYRAGRPIHNDGLSWCWSRQHWEHCPVYSETFPDQQPLHSWNWRCSGSVSLFHWLNSKLHLMYLYWLAVCVCLAGFFGDLLSLLCQSFSMVDMVLLLHGNPQPLSRIQPQLIAFFTEHYLQGREPTDANIAVSLSYFL